MASRKLKFLFVQPDFNRHYIPFLPIYEPLHALICEAAAKAGRISVQTAGPVVWVSLEQPKPQTESEGGETGS